MKKLLAGTATLLALMILQGCASRLITDDNNSPIVRQRTAADPLEGVNRAVFSFNEGLDRTVVKPVTTAYRAVTPELVRRGVSNVFSNINDIVSLFNNALQLKTVATSDTFFRVTVNTLWGLGGIFDVAGEMRIPKHSEDFGQTLGHWGVPPGPYLVLPLLGSSSVRDATGSIVDSQVDLVSLSTNVSSRNSLTALRVVEARSRYLGVGEVLDEAALDKYSFSREIYLQRRKALLDRAVEAEERFDLPEAGKSGVAPAEALPPPESAK